MRSTPHPDPHPGPAPGTRAGSGLARSGTAATAGAQAAREAMRGLGGASPSFGFVFASARQDLGAVMAAATDATGCASLVGCTSAGEFTEAGVVSGGVAVLLVHAPQSVHRIAVAEGTRSDPIGAARGLTAGFEEATAEARASGWAHPISIVLLDGLADTCEKLLQQLVPLTRPFQQLVGGAAGVEYGVTEARLGAGRRVGPDLAVALHVLGPRRWGLGLAHGLKAPPKNSGVGKLRVTRHEGNVIVELDGRPAFDAYRRHAEDNGLRLESKDAGGYLVKNPLGLYFLDELRAVRICGGVTPTGGLQCTAAIAEGTTLTILRGEVEGMVEAARSAARQARSAIEGEPAAALVFDCGTRGYSMGDAFQREIAAVREVFPDVPVVGLLTYGEIAKYRGRQDAWHHSTAVVVAIPR